MEDKANVQDQPTEEQANAQETRNETEQTQSSDQDQATASAGDGAPSPSKEEQLEKEVSELKDKYLRLQADLENMRKRHARERIDLIQLAGAELIKELLPVMDDFERALSHEEDKDAAHIEGLTLIYNKLKRTLEGKGLKVMDAMHAPFDTEFHEAITNIPAPSEDLKGKVVDVTEKGYFIHDTVIRYAKVVVGQ